MQCFLVIKVLVKGENLEHFMKKSKNFQFLQKRNSSAHYQNIFIFFQNKNHSRLVVCNWGVLKQFPPGTYFGMRVLKHFKHKNYLFFWSKYLNQFSIKLEFKTFINLDLKCFSTSRGKMFQYRPIVYYQHTLL